MKKQSSNTFTSLPPINSSFRKVEIEVCFAIKSSVADVVGRKNTSGLRIYSKTWSLFYSSFFVNNLKRTIRERYTLRSRWAGIEILENSSYYGTVERSVI